MKYRAALIGCGNIGCLYANDPKIKGIYTHAGAYAKCSKTELVSVCDINEEKAINCSKKWNADYYYSDIKKMLSDQKPEIVSICTADATHDEILDLVLNTPKIKGIIIEKPLALDVCRASELVEIAHKKEVVLIVNYNRRYAIGHQKIKEFIKNGSIGRVQKISGYYTKGILHNGTHWLDLARYLVGEIKAVQGFKIKQNDDQDPPIDAWLQFENGVSGFLQNLDANEYSLFEMDILGTLRRIRITDSGHNIEFFNVMESEYYTGYNTLKKHDQRDDNISDTLLNVVYDLVNSIENKLIPKCSGDDGLAVLRIANALIHSAENSSKVYFNSDRF
ncbi:MAG: Gfo/Idh/MocA family oxidoreductase [Gammaproteobacteria bacterium]|nr:Gfo/Idh/MocA family oxidoreductase [Gammaproteobacteria bacterium]